MILIKESFVFWLIAFLLLISGLWLANYRVDKRYRQVLMPLIGLIYSAIIFELYSGNSNAELSWLDNVFQAISYFFAQLNIGLPRALQPNLLFNWLVLFVFLLIKITVNFGSWIGISFYSGLTQFLLKKNSPIWSLAYQSKTPEGVLLKPNWYFSRLVLNGLSLVAFLQIVACIAIALFNITWMAPALPFLPMILTMESAWYLGGRWAEDLKETSFSGENTEFDVMGDYEQLWEKYLQLWPELILTSVKLKASETENPDYQPLAKEISDLLQQGKNLIIEANELASALPIIARRMSDVLYEGGKVLLLVARNDQAQQLKNTLQQKHHLFGIDPLFHHVADIDGLHRQPSQVSVLIATASNLLDSGAQRKDWLDAWFNEVRLVVLPDFSSLFASLNLLDMVLSQIRFKAKAVQTVFLCTKRQSVQSMVQRDLRINAEERCLPNQMPSNLLIMGWRADHPLWMQQNFFAGHIGKYLGNEMMLSLPAWKIGIREIHLFDVSDLPWQEQREELQNELGHLLPDWRIDQARFGTALERIKVNLAPFLLQPMPMACLIAYDQYFNLSTMLENRKAKATRCAFLHIVSPPYLLREYLTANIHYFYQNPLYALSPRKTVTAITLADTLWVQLITNELDESTLINELHRYNPSIKCAKQGVCDLFKVAYEVDIQSEGILRMRREPRFIDDSQKGDFVEVNLFSLLDRPDTSTTLPHTVFFRFWNEANEKLATVSQDRMHRNYLPGQIHVFEGRAYRIGLIDQMKQTVSLSHVQPVTQYYYRPAMTVELEACTTAQTQTVSKLRRNGWTVIRQLCVCSATVTTRGYFSSENTLDIQNATYEDLCDAPGYIRKRDWPQARCFKLSFKPPQKTKNKPIKPFTLAAIIHELLPTILPEIHDAIVVGAFIEEGFFKTEQLLYWFPQFLNSSKLIDDADGFDIFFVEDARFDTGAIQCLYDHYEYLFEIVYDYLTWQFETEAPDSGDWQINVSNKQKLYLAFGMEQTPAEFQLQETLDLLKQLGLGCGPNSLNANRTGNRITVSSELETDVTQNQHQCDFCGEEMPVTEFQRLSDGRERCQLCAQSAVDDLAQLKEIYQQAKILLDKHMRVSIREDIEVHFISAEEMHLRHQSGFIPTASYDARSIGMAIRDAENFSINIENGQPRNRILATMIHELTHIWQFDYLDFHRLDNDHGKLLIEEGHAMWAEITCLQAENLAPAYCEGEAARGDLYGQGYRAVLQILKAHDADNAFSWLLARYGK